MFITKARVLGATAVAAVAMGAALGAAPSEADSVATADGITIKAVLKGKIPKYTGPSKVSRGESLTFVNASDPKKIGPHTLSIVDRDLVPEDGGTRKGADKCFAEGICGTIAVAHKFDFETEVVNKPSVDKGRKNAWDVAFGKSGDTFYTEVEGATETRKVVGPVGSRLTLFCAVHPDMFKTIKIVD